MGDFAPSYTEYMTVYVLAEVWLPGEDGYLIHTTKGAHKNKVVTGQTRGKVSVVPDPRSTGSLRQGQARFHSGFSADWDSLPD